MKYIVLLSIILSVSIVNSIAADKDCQYPGICTPPKAKFQKVAPIIPRHQWTDEGGFCGSLSIQSIAMTYGAWICEEQVRLAAPAGGGHGNDTAGYEILHTNIEPALKKLKINYNAFDYQNTPYPQINSYLKFLKKNLINGHPVVQFVMCKGDGHSTYGIKNATYDHIEPFFGIYSNTTFDNEEVQEDDWIVHGSDYEPDGVRDLGYFRKMSSLQDTTKMDGNCKNAVPGVGFNEMYPCIDTQHDYGYALTGFVDPKKRLLPMYLLVDTLEEPDLIEGQKPKNMKGKLHISQLTKWNKYTIYRYDNISNFPTDSNFENSKYDNIYIFRALGTEHEFHDPHTILSSGTTYYACVEHSYENQRLSSDQDCVSPGVCQPPVAKFQKVAPIIPRHQWTDNGGYCGSLSIQSIAMTYGAWISEDQVRKAAPAGGGHGTDSTGYEILQTNIEQALTKLKLNFNAWDWQNQPTPQIDNYLKFLKSNLAQGHPIVQFVICAGDSHNAYGLGTFDHIEPFFGIYSNRSLSDHEVYPDDVLVHGSDYEPDGVKDLGYFRTFSSLMDTKKMDGNCKNAIPVWGKNEMYPCIDQQNDYGYAITGIVDPKKRALPLFIQVNNREEPDLVEGYKPIQMKGTINVSGLTNGLTYTIYRYDTLENVPTDSNYEGSQFDIQYQFVAKGETYVMQDPKTILSSGTTYYRCVLDSQQKEFLQLY